MLSRYVVGTGAAARARRGDDRASGRRDIDAVEQTLRALNSIYDFVILDIGTSLMMPAAAALQLSDTIMAVANPDVPCLRNLQRLIDAVKTAGVPVERLKVIMNRASEFGVLSAAQIERVLGFNISHSVASDYRTVASAVNSGVPVSALRASEINGQLDSIARAIAGIQVGGTGQASRSRRNGPAYAQVRFGRVSVIDEGVIAQQALDPGALPPAASVNQPDLREEPARAAPVSRRRPRGCRAG